MILKNLKLNLPGCCFVQNDAAGAGGAAGGENGAGAETLPNGLGAVVTGVDGVDCCYNTQ